MLSRASASAICRAVHVRLPIVLDHETAPRSRTSTYVTLTEDSESTRAVTNRATPSEWVSSCCSGMRSPSVTRMAAGLR